MAPGVLWVSALFAAMLFLFSACLPATTPTAPWSKWLCRPAPLTLLVAAKALSHFSAVGLPLVLMARFSGLQFGLMGHRWEFLMLTLLLGTPDLEPGRAALALP